MANPEVAGRYQILREVGRGGMATVYLVLDTKHQREVALKALRPDLAAVVGPDRFLREIEITAKLNHPHILPLLDSGAEDGFLYYVMPYVEGGSLRLLTATTAIPLEAAVRVTREVASALDHAHARGVIHRDIKPENILFNEGLAVVSDFGIAKAVSEADTRRMTGTGVSVGTLGYMSPEQALGTTELDPRSDVYSLGSVVYEMLLGETPAAWPSAEDVKLGRFEELPDDHRTRLDDLPGRVQQVLVKALALRPQHRYETPGDLAKALTVASERTTRFSDEQVRRLLRKAAELQAKEPQPRSGDLTIGHVEQIAAQVGIPPEHVRAAAQELARSSPGWSERAGERAGLPGPRHSRGPFALVGSGGSAGEGNLPAPTPRLSPPSQWEVGRLGGEWKHLREEWDRLVARESIEGEVPEEAFPTMVAEINRALDTVGHASIVGRTLTWTPAPRSDNDRKILVQVSAADGRTDIQVREELGIWGVRQIAPAVGGFFGVAFGGATSEAFGMGEGGVIFIIIFGLLGLLGAIRAVIGIDASERGPQIEALARSLAEITRTSLDVSPPASDPEP